MPLTMRPLTIQTDTGDLTAAVSCGAPYIVIDDNGVSLTRDQAIQLAMWLTVYTSQLMKETTDANAGN